jgi:CheY-like chemotaxis protein
MMGDIGGASPAPAGWLGTLGAWLRTWGRKVWTESDDNGHAATAPQAHFYGSVRVLVVDDNPVNLMVISALMESRGLVPWLAENGAEAVALSCELQFDFILMDLQMPVLDGLEATSAIRRFERDSALPPVPVIAYSSTRPGAELLAAHGLSGSLAKPCDDHELEACLVKWCPAYRVAPPMQRVAEGNSRWHDVRANVDQRNNSLH